LAKTVYTPEEFSLLDGKEIVAKPLPLSRLKKAMSAIDNAGELETTDDSIDFILGLTVLCLEGQLDEDYVLEDSLDILTGKRIIAVSTGIDLDAPNLVQAALEQSGQS
jgi:hypothetical protein